MLMEISVRSGPSLASPAGPQTRRGILFAAFPPARLPSIGCCLLATLMTAKFDMRHLANSAQSVAVRLSPERLYECLLFLLLNFHTAASIWEWVTISISLPLFTQVEEEEISDVHRVKELRVVTWHKTTPWFVLGKQFSVCSCFMKQGEDLNWTWWAFCPNVLALTGHTAEARCLHTLYEIHVLQVIILRTFPLLL